MTRTFLIALLLCGCAFAQSAPPAAQFLLRIEPVRSDLTLQNMTPDEAQIAAQHFANLKKLFADGKLTYAAQVLDPKGLWGIIVVNAPDAESAKALLDADPGVKAGLFRGVVLPVRVVIK